MKKSEKLYPFGFLFTKEKINEDKLPEYYLHQNILNNYDFYYDKANMHGYYIEDNNFVIINGHFKHIGISQSYENVELPKELLSRYIHDRESFLSILDFIAGRYSIIIGNISKVEVFHDASGTRSVYYLTDQDALASHLNLLCDNFETREIPKYETDSDNYYSLDFTKIENIKILIPNFSLELSTKFVSRFFPRENNRYTNWSEDERFSLVEHLWKNQLKFYKNQYGRLIQSLTGGYDSRVLLAMTKELKQEINYFTYGIQKNKHNSFFEKVAKLDEFLVDQILDDLTINHKYLIINETELNLDKELVKVLDKNTTRSHGRRLIPLYNKFFPEDDVIHIRGNLLEIGRFIYFDGRHSTERVKSHVIKTIRQQQINNFNLFKKNLNKSLKLFGYNDNIYGYDQYDLYYWEIRMGKWYSELLNETDSSFNTVTPFNMRAIIDISLSFPINQRINNYFFNELINRNFPVLNFYGKNDKINLYEKYKQLSQSSVLTSSYFNDIKLYNSKNQLSRVSKSYDNKIYIPKKFLLTGNFAEVNFTINSEACMIDLSILSKYKSKQARGYLKYEILKNNQILVSEDISDWNLPNNINIFNLIKGDTITIRIHCLRDIQRDSWEVASTLEILNFEEIPMLTKFSNSVKCTSPYSIII